MKLTQRMIEKLDRPGRYTDAGAPGLSVLVQANTAGRDTSKLRKHFVQRLTLRGGKRITVTIGSTRWGLVSLAEARAAAFRNYQAAKAGQDPRLGTGAAPTVRDALEAVIDIRRPGWRDAGKSEKQWRASMDQHAGAILDAPLDRVDSAAVLGVLAPIWQTRGETARRLSQRLAAIFKWGIGKGHLDRDPMIGVLEALPKRGNGTRHFAMLVPSEVGPALAKVRASRAHWATKAIINFIAFVACRSNEARGARWGEIEGATWTVPAQRTKAGKAHRVALSPQALAVLAEARERTGGEPDGLVFPSAMGRVMSDSTASKLVKELSIGGKIHGLRASFRTWAGETGKPRELAEAALGHVVGGVEGAYARGDALELRRPLMAEWGEFVLPRTDATETSD